MTLNTASNSVDLPMSAQEVRALNRSWIDNALVESGSRVMEHRNPADGTDLGDTLIADTATVDQAVRSARRCFESSWGRLSGAERKRLLHAFADQVSQHSAALSQLETLEVGRPTTDANAINRGADQLVRTYANMIDRVHGDMFDAEERRLGVVWRRARGVIGAITPWNVPVLNVLMRVSPALAAGNTIVVKPSENSARSAILLAQLAAKAGLPASAFNVVLGSGPETGNALASHPDINLVVFTGSTNTGMAIARATAEASLKPVLMECGGKSSQVILEDIFDDQAIWDSIFYSAFWNSGQWCVAKTRMLVPRALQDKAIEGLRKAAASWTVGDPFRQETRLGPLASALQRDRVEAYYSTASQLGEVIDLGCDRQWAGAQGCYAYPSVVRGLPRGSRIAKEEVFGPLMTVEAFDDINDAIQLANDTQFGLSASIWTRRSDHGFKLARSIEAGGVWVYSSAEAAKQTGPVLGTSRYFEPRKQSGYGVEGGLPGFLAYTSAQSVGFFN